MPFRAGTQPSARIVDGKVTWTFGHGITVLPHFCFYPQAPMSGLQYCPRLLEQILPRVGEPWRMGKPRSRAYPIEIKLVVYILISRHRNREKRRKTRPRT